MAAVADLPRVVDLDLVRRDDDENRVEIAILPIDGKWLAIETGPIVGKATESRAGVLRASRGTLTMRKGKMKEREMVEEVEGNEGGILRKKKPQLPQFVSGVYLLFQMKIPFTPPWFVLSLSTFLSLFSPLVSFLVF